MFSKLSKIINSGKQDIDKGKNDIYDIKSNTDKDIPFIELGEVDEDDSYWNDSYLDENQFFKLGKEYGKVIANRALMQYPDFPEGIKKKHDSDKMPKEMFVSYCIWVFHRPSKIDLPKDRMNRLYQNHESISYTQVCTEVDKGLKKASLKVWKADQVIKERKIKRQAQKTLSEHRPIPAVVVKRPF